MTKRREIINLISTVTELPANAATIIAIINDPEFKMSELERAISVSPSLSAVLLRLSNSVYYAGSRSIATIRQAITRLGAKKIYEIVVAASSSQVASREIKGYGLPPGELWHKMVLTSFATVELGEELKLELPDYTFTAALLHAIGKVLLGSMLEVDAEPILKAAREENIPFHEAEEKILGINHAEAGSILLNQWQLPGEIVNCVRNYNEPSAAEKPDQVTEIIHLAAYAVHMTGIGAGVDELKYRPDDNVLSKYKIRIKKLETALSRATQRTEEMLSEFQGLMES
jgi:HD-like signal output (HDOD) protein